MSFVEKVKENQMYIYAAIIFLGLIVFSIRLVMNSTKDDKDKVIKSSNSVAYAAL